MHHPQLPHSKVEGIAQDVDQSDSPAVDYQLRLVEGSARAFVGFVERPDEVVGIEGCFGGSRDFPIQLRFHRYLLLLQLIQKDLQLHQLLHHEHHLRPERPRQLVGKGLSTHHHFQELDSRWQGLGKQRLQQVVFARLEGSRGYPKQRQD